MRKPSGQTRERQHKNGQCPAQGKTCKKCNKLNHFANQGCSMFKYTSKNAQKCPLDADNGSDTNDSTYCYVVHTNSMKHPTANATINGQRVKFKNDIGSSINVISASPFQHLGPVYMIPVSGLAR